MRNYFSVLVVLMSFPAYGMMSQELYYNVYLDGDKIGYHKVSIMPEDTRKIVQIEASFKVKFLIFTAYKYHHTSREEWYDSCLNKIKTITDDNGEKLFVNGQRRHNLFMIKSHEGSDRFNGCVKSFAYWDPKLIQATRLLNTQTGLYVPVETLNLGEKEIIVNKIKVKATHYQISSKEFVIDLWYSADREWLALSTTTENGANLRYEKR